MPLLPELFFTPGLSLLSDGTAEAVRYGLLSLSLMCIPVAQFIFAPIMGRMADRYQKKYFLMASLVLAGIGQFVAWYAIDQHSVVLYFLSRIVVSSSVMVMIITSAVIAMNEVTAKRKKWFGYFFALQGIGFILGPLFGSFLVNQSLVSWFGLTTPFLTMALMMWLSAMLVLLCYREQKQNRPVQQAAHENKVSFLKSVKYLFAHAPHRGLLMTLLLVNVAWSLFMSYNSTYLQRDYAFTVPMIGWYLFYAGIVYTAFLVMIPKTPFINLTINKQIMITLSLSVCSLLIFAFAPVNFILWAIVPVLCFGLGVGIYCLNNSIAEIGTSQEKATVFGIATSIQNIAMLLGSALLFLGALNSALPLIVAASICIIAMMVFHQSQKHTSCNDE